MVSKISWLVEVADEVEVLRATGRPTVEDHLGLIGHIAKRYQGYGLDFEELVDEGYFGLHEAVKRFDPSRGAAFSTYATYWIRQAIVRALREQKRSIRLPDNVWEELNQLARERRSFWQLHQREPSVDELAEAMQCQRARVLFILSMQRISDVASLDAPMPLHFSSNAEEEDPLLDTLVAPDTTAQRERQGDVAGLLKYLSREERSVIVYRYQLGAEAEHGIEDIPLPFTHVARHLSMTADRAKTIEARALLKMRYWSERPHLRKKGYQ